MKTAITEVTKKVSVLAVLMTSMFFAHGQSKESPPAWLVSKDVQRFANKSLFEDKNLQRSHIQAKSTSPSWFISKGVFASKSSDVGKGNVRSLGIPSWTISKGVQRIGRE